MRVCVFFPIHFLLNVVMWVGEWVNERFQFLDMEQFKADDSTMKDVCGVSLIIEDLSHFFMGKSED